MVPHKLGYRHLQIDMRVITQDVSYIYIYIYKYLQALVYIYVYINISRPCLPDDLASDLTELVMAILKKYVHVSHPSV